MPFRKLNLFFYMLIFIIAPLGCGGGGGGSATALPPIRSQGWGPETKLQIWGASATPKVRFTESGKGYAAWSDDYWLKVGTLVSDDTWHSEQVVSSLYSFNGVVDLIFDTQEHPILVWQETIVSFDVTTRTIKTRKLLDSGWGDVQSLITVSGPQNAMASSVAYGGSGKATLLVSRSETDPTSGVTVSDKKYAFILDQQGNWSSAVELVSSYLPVGGPASALYPPMSDESRNDALLSITMSSDGTVYFFWSAYYVFGGGEASQWFARWNPSMPELEIHPIDNGSINYGKTALSCSKNGTVTLVWIANLSAAAIQLKTCKFSPLTGISETKILDSVDSWTEFMSNPQSVSTGSTDYIFWGTGIQSSAAGWKFKCVTSTNSSEWSPISILEQYNRYTGEMSFLPGFALPRADGSIWLSGKYTYEIWTRLLSPSLVLDPATRMSSTTELPLVMDGPVLATHSNGKSIVAWSRLDGNGGFYYLHLRMYR